MLKSFHLENIISATTLLGIQPTKELKSWKTITENRAVLLTVYRG